MFDFREHNTKQNVWYILTMFIFFFIFRATGFTTRSDIGPARDADDISWVYKITLWQIC